MILMIVLSRVASIDFLERVEISIVAIGEAYMCTMERSTPFFYSCILLLMLTYTGRRKQEGMRKTNFLPESDPGLMTSKPAH